MSVIKAPLNDSTRIDLYNIGCAFDASRNHKPKFDVINDAAKRSKRGHDAARHLFEDSLTYLKEYAARHA